MKVQNKIIFLILSAIFVVSGSLIIFLIARPVQQVSQSKNTPVITNQADRQLDFGYSIKNNKVFVSNGNREVKGSDAESFVPTSKDCAHDKNTGYRQEYAFPGSDPLTFVCLDYWYAKDSRNVYYGSYMYKQLSEADASSFVSLGNGYAKDAAHVYTYEDIIIGADPETFTLLDGGYAKDNEAVFYSKYKVPNADIATFRYLGKNNSSYEYGPFVLAADRNNVYRGQEVLAGIKPNGFQDLGMYFKDNDSVYYSNPYFKVSGADAKTFSVGENKFQGTDKTYLYDFGERVAKLGSNMNYIGNFYSKNNTGVFYKLSIVPNAQPDTFELLFCGVDMSIGGGGYAKDDRAVYYSGQVVHGADVSTFVCTPRMGYAKDKNNEYDNGKKIKNDFVGCGTDIKQLPEGDKYWLSKLLMLDNSQETIAPDNMFVEYCLLPDGSKLFGFVSKKDQVSSPTKDTTGSVLKDYYLFGKDNQLINAQPAVLNCNAGQNKGSLTLSQSLKTLDGKQAKLNCAWIGGACEPGFDIYMFDLGKLAQPSQAITPTDEFYDCGYRG
jgi:hypothetical protein